MIPAAALVALLFGGTVEPAADAREAAAAEVSLAVARCPALPRDEVAHLLTLELDGPVVAPEKAGDRAVKVAVDCAGSTVHIAVDDPAKGRQLRRSTVFPPEHADVVVRLVALAISELVLTSRADLPVEKAAPAARAEVVAPPPPPAAAPPAGRAYVLAVAQAVGPFSGVGLGWGGGLRLGWAFARRWVDRASFAAGPAADLELGAAGTTVDSALGSVQVSLWSATLRGSLRVRRGPMWLDVGGGGRFGLAHLEGRPVDAAATRGSAVAGTWAGPLAYAGLGARLGHVVIALGAEGGRVLRTVSALVDDGTPIAISGSWACATIAAGWGE